MAASIRFFSEGIEFKPPKPRLSSKWLTEVASTHAAIVGGINYVFVSDQYLLGLNQSFLKHDTFTDIITFSDEECRLDHLSGDIYISVERVSENADKFGQSFDSELRRVMAHGLLHMIGFGDKSAKDKKAMRAAEEDALRIWKKTSSECPMLFSRMRIGCILLRNIFDVLRMCNTRFGIIEGGKSRGIPICCIYIVG